MIPVEQPAMVGFTMQTRTSVLLPGSWGALAEIWEPAAYATAMTLKGTANG